MSSFPTSLDNFTNPTATDSLAAVPHHTQHGDANDAIEALEAKVGIGSSTPTLGMQLRGTATGTSKWDGITEIVYRAAGGTSDDAAAIQAIHDAATTATVVILPDTNYYLDSTVTITKAGFFIEGKLGQANPDPTSGYRTTINSRVSSGAAFHFSSAVGGGLRRVTVHGNSTGQDGIKLTASTGVECVEWAIRGFTGSAIILTGKSYKNRFHRFSLVCSTGTGISVAQGSNYGNSFTDFDLSITSTGTGLSLYGDDNWFNGYQINVQSASGTGVKFQGGDYGAAPGAANLFGYGFINGSGTHIRSIGDTFDVVPRRNLFLGVGTEDIGHLTIDADSGAFPSILDVEGRHNFRPDLTTAALLYDDFMLGVSFGWGGVATGTGVVGQVANVTNHPGIVYVGTGATSGSTCAMMTKDSTAVGLSLLPEMDFIFETIMTPGISDSNAEWRFGLMDAPTSFPPTDGIYLEKLFADTNYFAVCRSGGTQTRTDTGIAATQGTWRHVTIRRHNADTISFDFGEKVNNNSTVRITTNIPTAQLQVGYSIQNNAAASKQIWVDAALLLITNLSR